MALPNELWDGELRGESLDWGALQWSALSNMGDALYSTHCSVCTYCAFVFQ